MQYSVFPGVQKIAILRSLVLGDLIFALPALDALHKAYPRAEITWIGREALKEFTLAHVPGVSQYEVLRPSPVDYEDLGFLIDPGQAGEFFDRMRAERFDLALQMQGGGLNSNPFVRRLEARHAVGPREAGAIALDRWTGYQYHQSEFARQMDTVALAGAAPVSLYPRLEVTQVDRAAARPVLDEIGGPFVVLHAGARDIRRCWPPERFARLGDALAERFGCVVALTGSGDESEPGPDEVERRMTARVHNLSGRLSLEALTGVLAGAQLVVSNDTGPMHLALAAGTPSVGLFWVEYVIKSLPLRRDIFTALVDWNRHCPRCGQFMTEYEVTTCDPRPCEHHTSFVPNITVEDVLAAAERMLAVAPRP